MYGILSRLLILGFKLLKRYFKNPEKKPIQKSYNFHIDTVYYMVVTLDMTIMKSLQNAGQSCL
jgi:hypothetical protein